MACFGLQRQANRKELLTRDQLEPTEHELAASPEEMKGGCTCSGDWLDGDIKWTSQLN